jgi:hypothetical protein
MPLETFHIGNSLDQITSVKHKPAMEIELQRLVCPRGENAVFCAAAPGLQAIIAIPNEAKSNRQIILASVRHIKYASVSAGQFNSFVSEAWAQAQNLNRKLRWLDLLNLADLEITRFFTAGRILVISGRTIPDLEAWNFASACIQSLRKRTLRTIVTQPDYDQMYALISLRSSGSTIDLKTKHNPSVVGTIAAFQVILRAYIADSKLVSWGIWGVGNLGSRIINRLAHSSGSIFAYDIDVSKLEPFRRFNNVRICSYRQWLRASPHAVIFAAHSGSLTGSISAELLKNKHLLVLGGPEAGLDGRRQTIDKFTDKGIHYVPSLLCGSMGLVSNLCEILDKSTSVATQKQILIIHTESILRSALKHKTAFQERLDSYFLNLRRKRK